MEKLGLTSKRCWFIFNGYQGGSTVMTRNKPSCTVNAPQIVKKKLAAIAVTVIMSKGC